MPKQTYHHKNLKSELIYQGMQLLDKEGYDNFSLRKVAAACNVSQTAPYRHFKDKNELITAILFKAMQDFDKTLSESFDKYPGDPEKLLKEMGIAYITFFYNNPEYLNLLFSSNVFEKIKTQAYDSDSEKDHISNTSLSDIHPFATFQKAIQYFAATKKPPVNQNELTLHCWGLVHGISILLSNHDSHIFQGDVLKTAENIIWNSKF